MKKRIALILVWMLAAAAVAGNVWYFDVEAQSDQIPQVSREFGRGEKWTIAPRVLDNGVPRVWPTNAVFLFFWQRQNMGTNWWVSTNTVYPVNMDFTIGTTTPVVTTYVTNLTLLTYPTTNSYTTNFVVSVSTGSVSKVYTNTLTDVYTNNVPVTNTVHTNTVVFVGTNTFSATAYVTNSVVVTNLVYLAPATNTTSSSQYFTSYVSSYTTVNAADTGRVSATWVAGMDVGANAYNWFLGEFENGDPCYRINGTFTIRGAPGYGGTFTGNPLQFPWATTNFVTNIVGQVTAYALRAITNGAPQGYWILQTPLP